MRIAPRLRSAGVLARFGVSMLGSAGMRSEMCGWRSKAGLGAAGPGTAGLAMRGKSRVSGELHGLALQI